MYNIGDEVIVKLQNIDPDTKHPNAPAAVIEIIDPMHLYLVRFDPHLPMTDFENAWIVEGKFTPDMLDPAP